MHEMSIAQSLIEILREEMTRHGAKNLRSVRLHIGRLAAIVPESLSFCFQVMTAGTDMEGAKLVMETIPLEAFCKVCKKTFFIENYAFRCPSCGAKDIDTLRGQDLSIVDMEVD